MKKPLSILACTLVIGFGGLPTHALAQAKTAKACAEEWRADKAGFQAKGITEKAYVADCRAGTASAPAAAPGPMSPPPAATNTGQKTAKACAEEWRADKAGFQAKSITERAYVADCRAGTSPNPAPTAAAPAPSPMTPAPAAAGQKTAKACAEEWRADKAGFQAKGITEKAYVAACRSGTVATPAAAPAPAPTPTIAAPAPAPAPAPPAAAPAPAPAPSASRPSAQPPYGTTERGPSTGVPSGAGQFANEAQAKATCLGDTVVWVNLRSKIYHFAGTHNYGNTKDGAYMCERDTAAQGMRAAKNEQHP